MIRIILSFLLICCAMVAFGQDINIPPSIRVPDGSKLILHVYAKGVQIYAYTQDPKDTSKYVWLFAAPRANLYADSGYHHLIGKHYFDTMKSPVWEHADASKVTGLKIQQANSPDSLAISWLLLKAVAVHGTGILTVPMYIQRIRTKGGKAPSSADKSRKGQSLEVPYTAEYLFYDKK